MTARYVRNVPGPRENAAAVVVSSVLAVGVGLVAFYVTRLLLSREPLAPGRAVVPEDALPPAE